MKKTISVISLIVVLLLVVGGAVLAVYLQQNQAPEDSSAAANTTYVIPTVSTKQEYGAVISTPYYDYAPSVIYDGSSYRAYWCSDEDNKSPEYDVIKYAKSSSLTSLKSSAISVVLKATPNSEETNGYNHGHTCDPSVIQKNGKYYMYYTAASADEEYAVNNSIFLATSNDGITWSKNGGNSSPKAVINNTVNSGGYGIGLSSVVLKDNKIYHFYANSDKGGLMLATSDNGIQFNTQNNNNPIANRALTVTYLTDYNMFMGIFASDEKTFDGVYYAFSYDGKHWTRTSKDTKISLSKYYGIAHNAGFVTDMEGKVSGSKVTILFATGNKAVNDQWQLGTWDIVAVDIQLSSPKIGKTTFNSMNPIGYLDSVTNEGKVIGWALDPDEPEKSIKVNIYKDGPIEGKGVYVGEITANTKRKDVNDATDYPGDHGFEFTLPDTLRTQKFSVYAYGVDTSGIKADNSLLTNSPRQFSGSSLACSSFTYSDWSSCVSGIKTRTIKTSSPEGCIGGSPVLTSICTSGGGYVTLDSGTDEGNGVDTNTGTGTTTGTDNNTGTNTDVTTGSGTNTDTGTGSDVGTDTSSDAEVDNNTNTDTTNTNDNSSSTVTEVFAKPKKATFSSQEKKILSYMLIVDAVVFVVFGFSFAVRLMKSSKP